MNPTQIVVKLATNGNLNGAAFVLCQVRDLAVRVKLSESLETLADFEGKILEAVRPTPEEIKEAAEMSEHVNTPRDLAMHTLAVVDFEAFEEELYQDWVDSGACYGA